MTKSCGWVATLVCQSNIIQDKTNTETEEQLRAFHAYVHRTSTCVFTFPTHSNTECNEIPVKSSRRSLRASHPRSALMSFPEPPPVLRGRINGHCIQFMLSTTESHYIWWSKLVSRKRFREWIRRRTYVPHTREALHCCMMTSVMLKHLKEMIQPNNVQLPESGMWAWFLHESTDRKSVV